MYGVAEESDQELPTKSHQKIRAEATWAEACITKKQPP
jgi:hypothetical protein